jgi:copper chaperone CopZ
MTKKITFLSPFILCGLIACSKPAEKPVAEAQTVQTVSATVTVATISVPTAVCETCEKTIKTAVDKIDGVTACEVNAKEHTAKVQFIPAKTSLNAIEHSIAKSGYTADAVERDSAGYANLEECCKK